MKRIRKTVKTCQKNVLHCMLFSEFSLRVANFNRKFKRHCAFYRGISRFEQNFLFCTKNVQFFRIFKKYCVREMLCSNFNTNLIENLQCISRSPYFDIPAGWVQLKCTKRMQDLTERFAFEKCNQSHGYYSRKPVNQN